MKTQGGYHAGGRGLSGLIRREIRTETNLRFLRNMPVFKVERDMPDRFALLLERLERAGGAKKLMR